MAESIKDKVAIVGMGCTKFGELWDTSISDLLVDSCTQAFEDAGIDRHDVDAVWLGNAYEFTGIGGPTASMALNLQYKPVTRVENMCCTGSEALRGAAYAVAAGVVDIALACGVEKLKDQGVSGVTKGSGPLTEAGTMRTATAPSLFALLATRYFSRYGLTPEEGKTMLAKIVVKSHYNGSLHPKAHFRKPVSLEQVMNAPVIAWPLGLFDCCGNSDGSAAAIVVRASEAKKFRDDPLYIKAMSIVSGPREGIRAQSYDYTHVEEGYRAGLAAYAEAGIKNPRKEISLASVHDCFSISEAAVMEDLQFSDRGKVKEDIDADRFTLKGELPVNSDGGLKCFGHPLGASGLRMMYEVYNQVRGKAGDERQIENATLGLTHNQGGVPGGCVVSVVIAGL